ncbi:hypothetical protein C7N83_05785 [Neisseria iguanae]|uniref:Methylated-DNA--protein-cysteine methyltransferase n=1 Tax=Neisseria iguanae TaxID=90242 RepID=A0A2P7U0R7_9NEIS|nr:hypothetical protein C7N83_05785 [Neisseria iguanae]
MNPADLRFAHCDDYTAILNMAWVDTPIGKMLAVFGSEGLCLLEFAGQNRLQRELNQLQKALAANFSWQKSMYCDEFQHELAEYFSGRLKAFHTPLHMVGTDFQKQVWQVLLTIPYGATLSYKEQAQQLGNLKAIRAVAAANGQNKISILIPCHRVIGSDGNLTGYAGGINRKRFLLDLESGMEQGMLF